MTAARSHRHGDADCGAAHVRLHARVPASTKKQDVCGPSDGQLPLWTPLISACSATLLRSYGEVTSEGSFFLNSEDPSEKSAEGPI